MPLAIGMQAIEAGITEQRQMLLDHRVQATHSIQVDDRDTPYVSRLFNSLHIVVDVGPTFVLITLIRLHVVVAEFGVSPMDRR